MRGQFVHLEKLASATIAVHRLRQNVQAGRRIQRQLAAVVSEDFVGLLLADDARTDFKVLQKVEESLLGGFDNGLF